MIKSKVQAKLAKAFDEKLTDATDSFTCSKTINTGEFDFVTQTYATQTIEAYTGRGVFTSYAKDLVKPVDYQAEDIKAIVLQNEVTAKPEIGDEWVISKGAFKVLNIPEDPTSSIYTIQLRRV